MKENQLLFIIRIKKRIENGESARGYDWWEINQVKNVSKTNNNHSCPIPEEVARKIILSTTNVGDLIVDPFCGSGTILKVAKELGRNFVGIELSSQYCKIAKDRIKNISNPLGDKAEIDYDRNYSHYHCWNQYGKPACGQPLENHKQCCLCDTPYKSRKKSPQDTPKIESWEGRFWEEIGQHISLDEPFQKMYTKIHIIPAIKSFISKTLAEEREAVLEEVKEKIDQMPIFMLGNAKVVEYDFLQAKLLSLLQSKE